MQMPDNARRTNFPEEKKIINIKQINQSFNQNLTCHFSMMKSLLAIILFTISGRLSATHCQNVIGLFFIYWTMLYYNLFLIIISTINCYL